MPPAYDYFFISIKIDCIIRSPPNIPPHRDLASSIGIKSNGGRCSHINPYMPDIEAAGEFTRPTSILRASEARRVEGRRNDGSKDKGSRSAQNPLRFFLRRKFRAKQSNLHPEIPDEHFFFFPKFLPAGMVFDLSLHHEIDLIGDG